MTLPARLPHTLCRACRFDGAAQRVRIEELEEEVTRLREAIAEPALRVPPEWGLTKSEAFVMAALAQRQEVSADQYMNLRDVTGAASDLNLLRVYISKIRDKLEPWGVTIRTRWGHGYSLPPDTRATVLAILRSDLPPDALIQRGTAA